MATEQIETSSNRSEPKKLKRGSKKVLNEEG
jgi:hypothetical protein